MYYSCICSNTGLTPYKLYVSEAVGFGNPIVSEALSFGNPIVSEALSFGNPIGSEAQSFGNPIRESGVPPGQGPDSRTYELLLLIVIWGIILIYPCNIKAPLIRGVGLFTRPSSLPKYKSSLPPHTTGVCKMGAYTKPRFAEGKPMAPSRIQASLFIHMRLAWRPQTCASSA